LAVLLQDNFDGANGTHLANHTPQVGGPWVDDVAGWQLLSNHATGTQTAQDASVTLENKRTARVSLDFAMGNVASDDEFQVRLLDDGGIAVEVSLSKDAQVLTWDVQGNQVITSTDLSLGSGSHTLKMDLGPGTFEYSLDGVVRWNCPRGQVVPGTLDTAHIYLAQTANTTRMTLGNLTITN